MDGIVSGQADAGLNAVLHAKSAGIIIANAENKWRFQNWRRPKGCRCHGCMNLERLPIHLRHGAVVMCLHAVLDWEETVEANLITTEGKNDLLTQYLKGSGYTAAFYLGLVDNAGFSAYNAADTAAKIVTSGGITGGSNQWAEGVPYSNANRLAFVPGTASAGSIDNSGSPAAFNINAPLTVRGGFMATNNVKGGTSGKIYGEADFGVARSVLSGDTLNVTITCTV